MKLCVLFIQNMYFNEIQTLHYYHFRYTKIVVKYKTVFNTYGQICVVNILYVKIFYLCLLYGTHLERFLCIKKHVLFIKDCTLEVFFGK